MSVEAAVDLHKASPSARWTPETGKSATPVNRKGPGQANNTRKRLSQFRALNQFSVRLCCTCGEIRHTSSNSHELLIVLWTINFRAQARWFEMTEARKQVNLLENPTFCQIGRKWRVCAQKWHTKHNTEGGSVALVHKSGR